MKLLIHDLNEKEWEEAAQQYEGYEVISDKGNIKPCVGCFGCWLKTPGQCVIKDGYDRMGALIHQAEEVTVISRYTYGGFSSFVKNVMDRSIGWVLPYMEIHHGEMHHRILHVRRPTASPAERRRSSLSRTSRKSIPCDRDKAAGMPGRDRRTRIIPGDDKTLS